MSSSHVPTTGSTSKIAASDARGSDARVWAWVVIRT
jgi:hypothetical protein